MPFDVRGQEIILRVPAAKLAEIGAMWIIEDILVPYGPEDKHSARSSAFNLGDFFIGNEFRQICTKNEGLPWRDFSTALVFLYDKREVIFLVKRGSLDDKSGVDVNRLRTCVPVVSDVIADFKAPISFAVLWNDASKVKGQIGSHLLSQYVGLRSALPSVTCATFSIALAAREASTTDFSIRSLCAAPVLLASQLSRYVAHHKPPVNKARAAVTLKIEIVASTSFSSCNVFSFRCSSSLAALDAASSGESTFTVSGLLSVPRGSSLLCSVGFD